MFKTTKAKVIVVVVFSVICIITTILLILYHNIDISAVEEDNTEEEQEIIEETAEEENYPGIDLKGKYNQNDLKINKEEYKKGKINAKIPKIDGLKNKDVQNKINEELEILALNCYKEQVPNLTEVKEVQIDFYDSANFGNAISCYVFYNVIIADNVDETYSGTHGISFDLNTGDKITLDKLFNSKAPIEDILRNSYYYSKISRNTEETLAGDLVVKDYGDIEEDMMDFIQAYKRGELTDFTFSPHHIEIFYNDQGIDISMEKWADYICIYSRYLVDESLFEADNVGLKNIYTLSDRHQGLHYYHNYQNENNYFIEIMFDFELSPEDLMGEAKKQIVDQRIKEIEEEIERVKKRASSNPNEFYILNYTISTGDFEDPNTLIKYLTINEYGNSYDVTVHDFEENIEPIIIKQNRNTMEEYFMYDFSEILKIGFAEVKEFYNLETGGKEVP